MKKIPKEICRIVEQGFAPGSCGTYYLGRREPACRVTLKLEGDNPHRRITAAHLSRPEHYFSIYQSGCNWSCKKCHSWKFTQYATGEWMCPDDISRLAQDYAGQVTYKEPRERATAFHALDLCRGCGTCVKPASFLLAQLGRARGKFYLPKTSKRSKYCPGKLAPEQVLLSAQGFGPARNIISFTGGDLACQPEFYALCAEKIKELDLGLWVLFETNGYGLTPQNLDLLQSAGIDAFWLDIKAYDEEIHRRLTGASNNWVLKVPEEILKRGFVLEVLTPYIPAWVERDQIEKIATLLAAVDKNIPFTILAFFPEHDMSNVPPPTLDQMLSAYEAAQAAGLRQIKLGNSDVFAKSEQDYKSLAALAPGGW